MVLRTIPFIIASTLLAYAATAGAGPTDVKAPPDRALQDQFKKHGPTKYQAPRGEATAPPDAVIQARFNKNGSGNYRAPKGEATAPPGTFIAK
jgi:hypothetical protein